ncbi:6544_t:CDS:2, partial [Cetraspora pellucida]
QCASYKTDNLNLKHVEVQFLPSNTTSKIQSLDAKIIMKEKITYEISENDKVIEELVEIFKDKYNLEYSDPDEVDDSLEIFIVMSNKALKDLETIYLYLLQHKNNNKYL